VQLGQAANRGQVVRRAPQHALELGARLVVLALVEQRPAERDAGGQLIGELLQAVPAERDRAVEIARAAEAFGDAAERRRVLGRNLSASIEEDACHT
jgi:hypothetical protein